MSLENYDREVRHNQEMTRAHNRKGNYSNPLWNKTPFESIGDSKTPRFESIEDIEKQIKIIREIANSMVDDLKELDNGKY